ncbi:MAG: nucleoside phosphorylase [Firmicutes bacterium]|nr:nucleoside phosphorylase [Bacillota bacterium]
MKEIIPITEFFDDEPYLTPAKSFERKETTPARLERIQKGKIKTAIITFISLENQMNNKDGLVDIMKDAEWFLNILGASGNAPTYIYKNVMIVFMKVGAPYAVSVIEELGYFGIQNFIAFGTAGCIDPKFDTNKMVVVNRAIRDEGSSYHYLPPSIYIDTDPIVTAVIEKVLKDKGIEFERGITWTTDAIWRETGKRIERRRSQGAISVEMECSAFAAAAKRLGKRFGQFLFFSDGIGENNDDWKWIQSSEERMNIKARLIHIGIEMAQELEKAKG